MLATPPFGASSNKALLRANIKPPVELVVADLDEKSKKNYIKELNDWLAEVAKKNNLIFVNYYATMVFPGTDKPLDRITYDGIHPNAKGYQIMATVLRNTLKKHEILI